MSDWHDKETMRKTLESYSDALDKLLAICPKLHASTSAYNGRFPAPCSWSSQWGADNARLRKHATSVSIRVAEILYVGRSNAIQEKDFTWRSSFFKVDFKWTTKFPLWGWRTARAGSVERIDDSTGETYPAIAAEPARIEQSQSVTMDLNWEGPSFGLKDWFTKADEIATVCDACTDGVRAEYAKYVTKATETVRAWGAARDVERLVIPRS